MGKFISRKLIVVLAGVLLTTLVNIGVPEEVAANITEAIIWLVGTYLLAQGADDAVKEWRERN